MLEQFLPFAVGSEGYLFSGVLLAILSTIFLYVVLVTFLRSIFRRFESDVALVTLNVSTYPALATFLLFSLKATFRQLSGIETVGKFEHFLSAVLIASLSYWLIQLFEQVVVYYLKEYTQQSEVMWDDVLLPLLEAVVPVVVFIFGGALALSNFGVDLTGVWVTLGGATFIIGFAIKDILANFFSGVVLLIDTPFRFGDVLQLEDGSLGMLKRIGVRVTQLYMFDNHCNQYIPNSVLQGQNITNLSRPTSYYHCSTEIEAPARRDLDALKGQITDIMLAHPDTLGDLDSKLELIEQYFVPSDHDPILAQQQSLGRQRLVAESEVDQKLEEIDLELSTIVVTLQFAEKGGLTQEEIENVQMEYRLLLELIGIQVKTEMSGKREVFTFDETQDNDSLIELIRSWYRLSIRDPHILNEDEDFIPYDWERKINLLRKRVQRLYQKISRPEREETRLDDYVLELREWMKERFKVPRRKWQEPQILFSDLSHNDDGEPYLKMTLNFFVDNITLENGKRGDRVTSQIYQEILQIMGETQVS